MESNQAFTLCYCTSSVQAIAVATMNKVWCRKGTALLAVFASPVAMLASQESSSSISPPVAVGVDVAVVYGVELL